MCWKDSALYVLLLELSRNIQVVTKPAVGIPFRMPLLVLGVQQAQRDALALEFLVNLVPVRPRALLLLHVLGEQPLLQFCVGDVLGQRPGQPGLAGSTQIGTHRRMR